MRSTPEVIVNSTGNAAMSQVQAAAESLVTVMVKSTAEPAANLRASALTWEFTVVAVHRGAEAVGVGVGLAVAGVDAPDDGEAWGDADWLALVLIGVAHPVSDHDGLGVKDAAAGSAPPFLAEPPARLDSSQTINAMTRTAMRTTRPRRIQ